MYLIYERLCTNDPSKKLKELFKHEKYWINIIFKLDRAI